MKLDFLGFGGGAGGGDGSSGGGGSGGSNGAAAIADKPAGRGAKLRIPADLIKRIMRARASDDRALDDARPTVRVGVIAAILFFGLLLGFAFFAPISGAAIAEGTVTTSGDRILIQPVSGGLVAKMNVQEGQLVQAGQPLVQLNGIRSGAQLKQAQAKRDGLKALEARLIAERDGHEQLNFPADLMGRQSDPATNEAMRSQYSIWERHRGILQADRTVTDSRLLAAQARRSATEQQLALLNEELGGLLTLQRRGFASKNRVLGMQRNAAELQAQLVSSTSEMDQAEIQRQRVRDAQLMDIVAELNRVQSELAQVEPQLDVSRYMAEQDVLRSPVTGRVAGLAQVGPGTVIGPGQTMMQIVPVEGTLVIDARIRPQDIDDVHLDAEATVRFTSVNPHGRTSFAGRIVTLSPTQINDGQGPGYFRAQIAINDPGELERAGVTLQPGVPASVHITTERRTLWDYLISPFSDALSRSFREE